MADWSPEWLAENEPGTEYGNRLAAIALLAF